MRKVIFAGLASGFALLILSFAGIYSTLWLFPSLATEYFDPAFKSGSSNMIMYYLHPFLISLALSWFWTRFKGVLSGSFLTRGIEFGLIYGLIAIFPMMWLIYSTMNVSIFIVTTWFVLGVVQGLVAGLIFEKLNP